MVSPDDYLLMSGIQHFSFAAASGRSYTWNNNGPKTNAPPKAACSIPAAMMLP